ncbi:MAG TPA: ABC transporter permease [Candidatus Limnocylindrales bacterium]|nr:ABC transporter permease [Candidatus Limnocylindrales bacterium]
MTATASTFDGARTGPGDMLLTWLRRNGWNLGLLALLAALLAYTRLINDNYGPTGIQSLANAVLPLALAAVAQAICVIAGGIDLSIGSMMALTSVFAAANMKGQSEEFAIAIVLATLAFGLLLGAINGTLIVVTRVPDIVVTLAMAFVWGGSALLVLRTPEGGAAQWLKSLVLGPLGIEWVPKAAVVLLVVVAVIWLPLKRSRLGLAMYAIGSNELAAFRSGISVGRTKILAYTFTGLFAALAGLSLTANTGIGNPVPGPYTLMSVAAVVLGGVSLAGGRGGVIGPVLAVVILQLIQIDMAFLSLDPNLALVSQGVILIGVVMFGSLIQWRRSRR